MGWRGVISKEIVTDFGFGYQWFSSVVYGFFMGFHGLLVVKKGSGLIFTSVFH